MVVTKRGPVEINTFTGMLDARILKTNLVGIKIYRAEASDVRTKRRRKDEADIQDFFYYT